MVPGSVSPETLVSTWASAHAITASVAQFGIVHLFEAFCVSVVDRDCVVVWEMTKQVRIVVP